MNPEANEVRNKIHVGRLSEAVTADVLRSFFNQYGKVESIYIPRPFRSFAFVSFEDESTAQSLLGRELKINEDCAVTISAASPKSNYNQSNMNGRTQQGYGHWNTYDDGRGMNRNRSCMNKLMPSSNQMPHEWSTYLQQPHMHASQAQTQRQFTTPDMSQNTNAMAALNIINNPSVVAAIMSAAAARAQQGDVSGGHMMSNVSSGLGSGGYMGKPDAAQNQQQSQQQPQPQQQFLYSHLPNQNSWGY